jgi:hypothetical protein
VGRVKGGDWDALDLAELAARHEAAFGSSGEPDRFVT